MIKLAITDDHPSIIEGLKTMFKDKDNFSICGVYSSGKDTVNGIVDSGAEILFLDIGLPDISGVEVCKQVKEKLPDIGIIVFTSYKDTKFLRETLDAGALGFMLKNSSYDEMLEAISCVYSNQEYIQPEMKEELINESLNRSSKMNYIPKLTRREKEILTLILEELTTQEMADKLFISFKTVETHRLNLLQKLGARNTAGLVRIAIEHSLV